MKYLLSVLYAQGEDESDGTPDYFLLPLTPSTIKYLRGLHQKVRGLWELNNDIRSIDVSFSGEYVQYDNIETLGLAETVEEGEVHIVDLSPAEIDAEIPIEEVWKMEAHSVRVYWDGDVTFYAFYKYNEVEFQTPLISIEYLEEAIKEEKNETNPPDSD